MFRNTTGKREGCINTINSDVFAVDYCETLSFPLFSDSMFCRLIFNRKYFPFYYYLCKFVDRHIKISKLWLVTSKVNYNDSENLAKPIEVGWVQFYMILKTILTLSIESASVEHGFNINKTNQESITALVKDHMIAKNLDDD